MESIRDYLNRTSLPASVMESKLAMYGRNPDIAAEFEHWITTGDYLEGECVSVEGYTARKLAGLSEFLDGEGAFHMLVQLRESPEKALEKISRGFKMK